MMNMEEYKRVGLKPPQEVPTVNMKTIPYSDIFTVKPPPFFLFTV